MRKFIEILFIAVALVFAESKCFPQTVITQFDTIKVSQGQDQTQTQTQTQTNQTKGTASGKNNQGNINKPRGNSQYAKGNQGIKQVKSARPDMTKARGARPSNIVRPSGSGIPKGVGKPGGAGRFGGR